MECLEIFAHISAIATALVALIGYILYRYELCKKRSNLETYLKNARTIASDDRRGKVGQHSYYHLMKEVGLTETEILQASFKSKHIDRFNIVDGDTKADKDTRRAVGLLFGYRD